MLEFDTFSIDDQLRSQQNKELIKKVHDLFFDIQENDDYFQAQCEEPVDLQHDYEVHQTQKANEYIKLIPQDELQLARSYTDKYPILDFRRKILIFQKTISKYAKFIVTHTVFEMLTLFVIVFNSIMLAMDDPTSDYYSPFSSLMDQIFLIYYTTEACLKIVAQGFIIPKTAYLREVWNVLDFTVIITAFLPYFVSSNSLNLNSLRSFRVLRTLRTISSIKSLKMILLALFSSLAQLRDVAIVLVFFYTIFAIAGVQLFAGYLKRRCFTDTEGITLIGQEQDTFCSGDSDCPTGYICGKQIANPSNDLINFDTFGWAFLQVFVITTLEGWSTIQEYVMLTFSPFVVFYFLLVVILGAFFLVNLTLAVIKLNFRPEKIEEELKLISQEQESYNYWQLRNLALYQPIRQKVITTGYGISWDKNQKLTLPMIKRKPKKQHTMITPFLQEKQEQQQKKKIKYKSIKIANQFSKPFMLQNKYRLEGIYGMVNQEKGKIEDPIQSEQNISVNGKINKSKISHSSSQGSIENQRRNSKTPTQRKDQQSISGTEFGSINLSELSESELDNRLEDMDIDVRQVKIKIINNLHQKVVNQKTFKKEGKKFKDYLQSEVNDRDMLLEDKHLKLKAKLINIKFYPIVKIDNETFTSLEDVLESKLLKEHAILRQQQEHKIKAMPLKIQYCFRNQKQSLINEGQRKKLAEARSKMKSTKKPKVYHGIRRVKPILDDIHPIEEFLMMSQYVEEETRREEEQVEIDVQNSQNYFLDSHDRIGKRKKILNQKVDFDYAQMKLIFQDSTDSIINMSKNATVEVESNQKNIFLSYNERELQKSPFFHEYQLIKRKDIESNGNIVAISSLEDVLQFADFTYFERNFTAQMNSIMKGLNYDDREYFKWIKGTYGLLLVTQRNLYYIVYSSQFENVMNLIVAMNTVILALDGLISEDNSATLIQFNYAFTIIFTIELGMKVLGVGMLRYIRDALNIFDAIIVSLSLIELFVLGGTNGKSSLSAFRSVRIFRAFRVLRVTKLMKSLRFMEFLIKVLVNSFQSLMYILLLMIIFMFIFMLLGMSFFGGLMTYTPSRQNFDTLQASFLVVFQVLTLENWNALLYELLLQPISSFITLIYLVLWIMIGNYVFLNLFLAILLENFEEEYRLDKSDLDQDIQIAKNLSTTQGLPSQNIVSSTTNIQQTPLINVSNQPLLRRKSLVKVQYDDNAESKQEPKFEYFTESGMCQLSLQIFSQQNQFRRIMYRLVKDTKFEGFILILICLTSLKLIIDTYLPQDGTIREVSLQFDIYFAILFGTESLMKIIAFGFVQEEATYLRESWNILDFFIVIASIVDVSVSSINLSFVKILRLLRTLRPLRFITHNKSMKILVSALLQSINGILNVGLVIILIWLMFAILGVSLMKNKLHFCNLQDGVTYYYGKQECLQLHGSWDNRDTNFDNILSGMLTLFIMSTLEGWPDYMYYFVDADESGPIFNSQIQFSWYFVVFILFGAILLINLFIGVILVNYHLAEEASRDQNLTQTQSDWIELQKLILHSNPNMSLFFPPENKFRALIFRVIRYRFFDPLIMSVIVLNIITMGLSMEEASQIYDTILQNLNTSFTFVFIGEASLKLIALGPVGYISSGWNQFDFFVVCASILDLILEFSGNSFMTFLKVGPQIARVFRVLRVTRLFRLVKQFQGLQKLIDTALYSLPAMLNATALLFLVFFIFSILGVFLFQGINKGYILSDQVNFQDFHHSFEILFQCSTGENWYLVMFDTMAGGQYYNCIFFIIFILIQQYIMLNLFILIILDQYEVNYFNSDNPLNKFQEFENIFVESWSKFAHYDKGMKMHNSQLSNFIFNMEQPLGYELDKRMEEDMEEWKNINNNDKNKLEKFKQQLLVNAKKQVFTQIMKMNINSDSEGLVRYHQILFSVLKSYLWEKLNVNLTEEGAKRILLKEEETRRKMNRTQKQVSENQVNPIVQYLFVSLAFKTMKRYKFKKKSQMEKMAQLSVLGQECYSEGNTSNTSYDQQYQDIYQRSLGSVSQCSEPEYGQIKYLQIPNNQIYENMISSTQSL